MVVNVPPYCTKDVVRRLFSPCGKVLHVYLEDKPTKNIVVETSKYFPEVQHKKGFKIGFVVFRAAGAIQKALDLPYDKPLILSTKENPVKTGLSKWVEDYKNDKVDVKELQTEIDTYMEKYDRLVEQEKEKALEEEGVPDEEGWVTVTRHNKKNKPTPHTEAMDAKLSHKEQTKRQKMEYKNFYAFQARETKRNEIASLRKKFEEDKQKIATMKAARKFKPY